MAVCLCVVELLNTLDRTDWRTCPHLSCQLSCSIVFNRLFLTFIKCDEIQPGKGFYLRNYRWSASSGLFETLPVDLYCKNSLCTGVNCQRGPDQRTSHLHKYSKVDSYIINLTTTRLRTRPTDFLAFRHKERGAFCKNCSIEYKNVLP